MTGTRTLKIGLLLVVLAALMTPRLAGADDRRELVRDAQKAMNMLLRTNKAAKLLQPKARAVLVFPNVVKAGLMFGGSVGDGVLFKAGKPVGYYNTVSGSYGLQAGVQVYGYALVFMNDAALSYLDKSDGFEVGVGPSIVVVDEGVGKSMTSTTISQDVYAFIFDQKGLMGGLGVQGSKITKLAK
jgi:lipid-binding SYLF domain-containing protein